MGAVLRLGWVFLLVSGAGMGAGRSQVELIEDSVAEVVNLRTGAVSHVSRSLLPKEVREGDVLLDGRIDLATTRRLTDQVRTLQKRVLSPMPPGFSLDDAASTSSAHR